MTACGLIAAAICVVGLAGGVAQFSLTEDTVSGFRATAEARNVTSLIVALQDANLDSAERMRLFSWQGWSIDLSEACVEDMAEGAAQHVIVLQRASQVHVRVVPGSLAALRCLAAPGILDGAKGWNPWAPADGADGTDGADTLWSQTNLNLFSRGTLGFLLRVTLPSTAEQRGQRGDEEAEAAWAARNRYVMVCMPKETYFQP